MINPTSHRRAFTLLELLGVVAILGLLAGVVGTSFGGRGRVRLQQAEETLRNADVWVRQLTEQCHEPVRLRINLNEQLMVAQTQGNQTEPIERRFGFPRNVEIIRVLTTREERSSGEVVVNYNRRGASDSFAVQIESTHGERRWVVFAGGTGQAFVFNEQSITPSKSTETTCREADVEDFFRTLRKKRLHVD